MSAALTSELGRQEAIDGRVQPAARALRGQLEGLRQTIATLPCNIYTAAPSRVSGSIGAHVRHCLDHVRALVAQGGNHELSYDARLRGTAVETDPFAAVAEIDRLCLELEDIDARRVGKPVRLRSLTERHGVAVQVRSTLGRELVFVIQHTIHHAAIIGVLLDQLGVTTGGDFGYAPSTPLAVHNGNSQLPTPNSHSEPLVRAG